MAKFSSIKIRSKRMGDKVQIRTLIAHPMENGRNRDADGNLIPAHYIEEIVVSHNDQVILSGDLGGSIARDPFFTFVLNSFRPGDKITISWVDNQQLTDKLDHYLKS